MAPMVLRIDDLSLATKGSKPWQPGLTMPVATEAGQVIWSTTLWLVSATSHTELQCVCGSASDKILASLIVITPCRLFPVGM